MIGKLLIGTAVVVGGYLAYRAYQSSKGASGTTTTTDKLTPAQQEQAAYIAQKYIPGYAEQSAYVDQGFNGGCIGCMGAARVQIL